MSTTSSTHGARDHARAQAGARVESQPVLPAAAAERPPAGRRPRGHDLGGDPRARGVRRAPPAARRPPAAGGRGRRRLRDADGAQRDRPRRAAQRGRHGQGAVERVPRARQPAALGHGAGADEHRGRHQRPARRALRPRPGGAALPAAGDGQARSGQTRSAPGADPVRRHAGRARRVAGAQRGARARPRGGAAGRGRRARLAGQRAAPARRSPGAHVQPAAGDRLAGRADGRRRPAAPCDARSGPAPSRTPTTTCSAWE